MLSSDTLTSVIFNGLEVAQGKAVKPWIEHHTEGTSICWMYGIVPEPLMYAYENECFYIEYA